MNKEKNVYYWKFFLVIFTLLGLGHSYLMIYSEELGIYKKNNDFIILIFGYNAYTDSICFIFLSLFITSIFTFFISDKIFKKWLIFTAVWMISTVILVLLAPVSGGGLFGLGPDKELVSIWMSSLFVFISILMFIIMSVRERKYNK